MPKVVMAESPMAQSLIFNVDFRIAVTSTREPHDYHPIESDDDSANHDAGWTEAGQQLLESINGLPGIEYVRYRPFSFHVEFGYAFDASTVIQTVLDAIRGVGQNFSEIGPELELYYLRRGRPCPLREQDFETALRELDLHA